MRDYQTPDNINYETPRTTSPVSTADSVKGVGQFGVEQNQVGQTVPDLTAKAMADLRNKVAVQRNG